MTGLGRRTIQTYIQMEDLPSRQKRLRENIATPYMPTIIKLVSEGLKPKAIFNRISNEGYTGSERFLRYIINERGGIQKPQLERKRDRIDRTQLSIILWKKEDTFTDNQKKQYEDAMGAEGDLVQVRNLVQQFRTAIEKKDISLLVDWINRVETENNQCFCEVVASMRTDIDAIKNALKYSYSNGPLEGNINRLKAIKRQMYGRAKFDLLKKKVLYHL